MDGGTLGGRWGVMGDDGRDAGGRWRGRGHGAEWASRAAAPSGSAARNTRCAPPPPPQRACLVETACSACPGGCSGGSSSMRHGVWAVARRDACGVPARPPGRLSRRHASESRIRVMHPSKVSESSSSLFLSHVTCPSHRSGGPGELAPARADRLPESPRGAGPGLRGRGRACAWAGARGRARRPQRAGGCGRARQLQRAGGVPTGFLTHRPQRMFR